MPRHPPVRSPFAACLRAFTPLVLTAIGCSSGGEGVAPKQEQTLTLAAPGGHVLGRPVAALVASATSGLAVVVTSATTPVCTVSGTALTLVAAGSCTLHANQAGDATHAAAPQLTLTFEVLSCPAVADVAGTLISFDDVARTYTVVGFNGDAGAVVADPAGGCNTVGADTRSAGSQYDGVTFGTLAPAANPTIPPIPFTATTNTLTLRVFVPTAPIRVHLKIENAANGTINYETEVMATQAGTWQTLTFTLDAPLVGGLPGQAFNLANTYSRVSVFFGFGAVQGATAATFHFDDLRLVP
jgi:hypothetical protein